MIHDSLAFSTRNISGKTINPNNALKSPLAELPPNFCWPVFSSHHVSIFIQGCFLQRWIFQTINEKGELVGIENMSTAEKNLGVNASMEDIRKEMFEGENIVTTQTDHGLSQVLNQKKEDGDEEKKEKES